MPPTPNSGRTTRGGRPSASPYLLNPLDPSLLGRQNAILSGTGNSYYVPDFEGCLSVKSVISGSAVWEVAGRRFTLHENCYLILNDRQRYTMTIDSARKVTTFCIFFRRGLVEDVLRSAVTSSADLLDAPEPAGSLAADFFQKIEPGSSPVMSSLRALKRKMGARETSRPEMEEGFTLLAAEIIREHRQADSAIARLPALRRSTQEELYRRALRGRDYLLSSLDETANLRNVARAACMSPYHFHRVFTQIFGETPHRFFTRHRLNKAVHLLRHTNCTVTEICFETGFESLGSFSSLFRRHFGVPPSDLRANGQKSKVEEALAGAGN